VSSQCRSLPLILFLATAGCPGRAESEQAPQPGPAATPLIDAGPAPDAADSGQADGAALDAGPALDVTSLDGAASTSIGGPAEGSLEGAVPFPAAAAGVMLNPRRLNPGGHFGTVETVQGLLRAAAVVDRELPGGQPLVVNDLGFASGGPIAHHGSHQAGRDVDVLFYLFDKEGHPRPAKGVPLDTKGRGWDFGDLVDPADDLFVKLDAPRTWRFLQALAEDDAALVQRVFVAEHVRTLLLEAAKRAKAPRAAVQRVEELTCQPGTPHDDHLHIRFFCSAEDLSKGCLDSTPMYPWRRAQLKAAGQAPALWRPSKARPSSKTTAEAEAGPMHWKVKAFLKLRETWSAQPHPGRPYCR
jgi:penicillin-insensitive murein DD-endopeptidase